MLGTRYVSFLIIAAFSFVFKSSYALMDISPHAAEGVVDSIRSHIFVDSRHVKQKSRSLFCDSLSGPKCGDPMGSVSGTIPFPSEAQININLDVLHHALPLELWNFNYTSILTEYKYLLPSPSNLVLRDLPEGGRITSHYSMTLPSGTGLAKLEGRWLLEDSVSMETFLPAYIRFSQPVLIKNLWAELSIPPDFDNKSMVIVVFRLGTETVWTTEAIMDPGFTMDITNRGLDGHGPLRACDQIVIFSTVRGLKIVSIEFDSNLKEEVLVPTLLLVPGRDGTLMFKQEKVDASTLVNRQVISIKEAIEKGLELNFPARRPVDENALVAELVAKDIGIIAPVEKVYAAIRSGDLALPHELKKALLKHEKDINKIVKRLAKTALSAIVKTGGESDMIPQRSNQPRESSKDNELQSISDLFVAALMHL
jgi:hypothetical protein